MREGEREGAEQILTESHFIKGNMDLPDAICPCADQADINISCALIKPTVAYSGLY